MANARCHPITMANAQHHLDAHKKHLLGSHRIPPRGRGVPRGHYGFAGRRDSEGASWRKGHPFSPRSPEPVTVPGLGTFSCAAAVLALMKALAFDDANVAHALLRGDFHAALRGMVRSSTRGRWDPLSAARYVTLLQWEQCPMFQVQMRKMSGRVIHACSRDRVFGTGGSLPAFQRGDSTKGSNYLGRALEEVARLVQKG